MNTLFMISAILISIHYAPIQASAADLTPSAKKELQLTSQNERTTLIELYSSEGCSSCPPAEKQLSGLLKDSGLWTRFVPVNFHVDYWNNLGWVDPYSNKQFTLRQNQYASFWGVRSIYTPAFVNNAESENTTLSTTLTGKASPALRLPKIKLNVKNREASATVENLTPGKDYELHIALLGNELHSSVTAGENNGRELIQNFAVLDYKTVALVNGKANTDLHFTGTKAKPKSLSVAAWVTEVGKMIPLQSLGGDL